MGKFLEPQPEASFKCFNVLIISKHSEMKNFLNFRISNIIAWRVLRRKLR